MLDVPGPEGSLVGVTLGSYRVTGKIGAGGMGVVYRAEDLRLGRTVAVKALPETTESDAAARRKMMNEARRASRVASPYVATVFDVVEQDDRAYIVMEYIEGRTLAAVLREDRPSVTTVTGCAIEIAEALGAIHTAGLVHRDLKPSNVMVTPAGHVKVMDFGLAKENAAALLQGAQSISAMTTQSTPGSIAGTILYMSPEQLRGEPLDARSDLFSFGTLLYEAVTGVHPFERASLLASASAILKEPAAGAPDPPQLASSPVGTIVDRLLEKDRDRRYASADAVRNDLRAVLTGAALSTHGAPGLKKKRVARIGVGTALAGLIVTGYLLWPSRPPHEATGSRPTLAVLPFEDRTGEPKGDLRAELLGDLLATDLADSTLARAMSTDRVREIVLAAGPGAASLAAVAKGADVRWIVAGTLYKEADSLYALIDVYRPGEKEPFEKFRAAAGSTAAIAELASATLRKRLFPDRKDDASSSGAAEGARSSSEEALLLQQEAKRDLRELRYREAIDKLDRAVRLDPGFLTAQVRLAEVLDKAGYATRARETADRALRTIDQSGGGARDGTLAWDARAVHARIHSNADDEIAARRALVELHGDDPATHLGLARALELRGHAAEALPEVDLAIALDPKDPGAHLTRARVLAKTKRYEDAATEFERAEALFSEIASPIGKATVTRARGDTEYARARYAQAEGIYQSAARELAAANLPLPAANARKAAGDCELMQGNLDAAVALYGPVLAAARSAGDQRIIVNTLSSLGAQYLVRGDFAQAERTLREARDEALGLGNPRLLAGPTLNLASALESSGRGGESRALAEEALALARDADELGTQGKALLLLANARYREGRLAEAIRSYREVLDSAPLANAPGTPLGNVHLGLASILREAGRLKEAAASADEAVAVNRAGSQRALLGYSLVARARVRADLRLDAGAQEDLDEAAKLVADPAAPLEDLKLRVELGRAELAAARGRWDDAERKLAPLRAGLGPESGAGLAASVFGTSAEVATADGRAQDAIRYARRAVESPSEFSVQRTWFRVDLARAHVGTGDKAAAELEARRALDEADRIGLPIVVALATAVIVQLHDDRDDPAMRARGRAALEGYFDAAPEDRREALRTRNDLQSTIRTLEEAVPNHSR